MPNVNRNLSPHIDRDARGPLMSELDLASAVRSDACVLLTGRRDAVRAVARQIHTLSGWRQGPFTIIDCGWPERMVERVLFGVFGETRSSAAPEPHPRPAQAGTVLLKDVCRLSPSLQSRLADRLLSWRGTRRPASSRCRLMASTSEPLLARVIDGRFNDQLFYRLNVIHLVVSQEKSMEETRRVRKVPDRYLVSHGAAPRTLSFPTD